MKSFREMVARLLWRMHVLVVLVCLVLGFVRHNTGCFLLAGIYTVAGLFYFTMERRERRIRKEQES